MTENNNNENSAEENLNVNTEKTESVNTGNENTEDDLASRFQEFFTDAVEEKNPKMTETLLTFLELKNVDEELTEIEDEKGDLPENIQKIKSKLEEIVSGLEEKKKSLSEIEEERGKLAENNNSVEEKINKYDEQKFNVRSNKEYDEIVKAIESLFDEVKKSELRIKEIDDTSVKLSADIESLSSKVEELNTELSEKQSLLDELNEQYMHDESELKEKRNVLLSKIDSKSSALYERINSSYKGEATAIVRKSNCSGCYNSIPPQRVIEIKSAERIFTCQSCGRILISEEIIPA